MIEKTNTSDMEQCSKHTPDIKTRPPSMWNSEAQKMDQESPFLDIIYFLVR